MELFPIESYLPQKRPFIMVDKICNANESECCTETSISEENIMVKNGVFIEAGILENIAQTCACHIGFVEIHIRENPIIRIGVVAQIKGLEITRYPQTGEVITTNVKENENFGDVSIYTATISSEGEPIAQGELRVVLTDKIS